MKIPVLTLHQPWASLVAIGAKGIETRSWSTGYRGPLAIHAAKSMPRLAVDFCYGEPAHTILMDEAGVVVPIEDYLPRGVVLAIATLEDVRATGTYGPALWLDSLTEQERAFGDYTLDRFGWMLRNVWRLPEPIPAKGAQGLWRWECPDDIWAQYQEVSREC